MSSKRGPAGTSSPPAPLVTASARAVRQAARPSGGGVRTQLGHFRLIQALEGHRLSGQAAEGGGAGRQVGELLEPPGLGGEREAAVAEAPDRGQREAKGLGWVLGGRCRDQQRPGGEGRQRRQQRKGVELRLGCGVDPERIGASGLEGRRVGESFAKFSRSPGEEDTDLDRLWARRRSRGPCPAHPSCRCGSLHRCYVSRPATRGQRIG